MGLFLSLAGVIGRGQQAVTIALQDFAAQTGMVCKPADYTEGDEELYVLQEQDGNTTIFLADGYTTAENVAEFLSKRLAAAVFALHIHDGDLWMYILYYRGEVVDQFNPIPDYWDEDISKEEVASWQGNAATIAAYVPAVQPQDFEKYLVRWDLDAHRSPKAYATDEYAQEEWQMLDFMKRLKLPYPINENGADGKVLRINKR